MTRSSVSAAARARGFTLTEVTIYVAVLAVVGLSLVSVVLASTRSASDHDIAAKVEERNRTAVTRIEREFRQAITGTAAISNFGRTLTFTSAAGFDGRFRWNGAARCGRLGPGASWELAPDIADSRYVVNMYFYNELKIEKTNEINRLLFGYVVPRRIRDRRGQRFCAAESEGAEQIHRLATFDMPVPSRYENAAAGAHRMRGTSGRLEPPKARSEAPCRREICRCASARADFRAIPQDAAAACARLCAHCV